MTDEPDVPPTALHRRKALKTLLGIGLATGLEACGGLPEVESAPAPSPSAADVPSSLPEPTTPVSEHEHPADGDRLVFAFGDREGQVITVDDLQVGSEGRLEGEAQERTGMPPALKWRGDSKLAK